MAKEKATPEQIKELHDKSGLPVVRCRAALEAHGPDVDATLSALISAREVKLSQLNPDLCSAELYGQAQRMESENQVETALRMMEGLVGGAKKKGQIPPKAAADPGKPANPEDEDIAVIMRRAMEATLGGASNETIGQFAKKQAQSDKKRAERKKKGAAKFEQPPLPVLTFDDSFWEGRDTLPAWAGFQERQGPYTSGSSEEPSTGEVTVSVRPPGDDDDVDPPVPPAAEQVAAYRFLKANDAAIAKAVVAAVFKEYPQLRENYGYDAEEAEELMPEIAKPEELRNLIGLGIVHVLPVAKDGMAYVGFELGCTWDDEHGLGVMTHGKRVIAVGDASTGFDSNAAEADGGEELADG